MPIDIGTEKLSQELDLNVEVLQILNSVYNPMTVETEIKENIWDEGVVAEENAKNVGGYRLEDIKVKLLQKDVYITEPQIQNLLESYVSDYYIHQKEIGIYNNGKKQEDCKIYQLAPKGLSWLLGL